MILKPPAAEQESIPTLGHRDREFRGIFAGVVPITIGMIFFVLGTYFVLDRWHGGRIEECQRAMMAYPDAEILSRTDRTITQPFGIMETVIEMRTTDDPATVQSWYSRTWGRYVRQQVQNRDRSQLLSIPPRSWEIDEAPDGGSLIHLTLLCP